MDYPNRKPNRIKNFDYSECRYYFITICTKNRENHFGTVENSQMKLSEIGKITEIKWKEIASYFPDVELDEFIVMPNHIHGIISFFNNLRKDKINDIRNRQACSLHSNGNNNKDELPKKELTPNKNHQKLPVIIGSFKSGVTRIVNQIPRIGYFCWQKSYYDHIIRNEKELGIIREYININPMKWPDDDENPENINPTSKLSFSKTINHNKIQIGVP
jgi:putative transposase